MTIEEILALAPDKAIEQLMKKNVKVQSWEELSKVCKIGDHPVHDKSKYPDQTKSDGTIDEMTRVTYNIAKVIASRMTGFCFGIPAKRIYHFTDDQREQQEEAQALLERIYSVAKINSVNIKRFDKYFSSCEILTLWYATQTKTPHFKYGIQSSTKLRNRTFSPIDGHKIYPIFDEYGDYVAVSIWQEIAEGEETVIYFDTYTDTQHIQYADRGDGWIEEVRESISLLKNPTIYASREEAIYSDGIGKIYEIEWSTSRAGNYLRKNTNPLLHVAAEAEIGGEESEDNNSGDKRIFQTNAEGKLSFVTWELNKDSLEFYNNQLRDMVFTETQMPDISFDKMSKLDLSGVAFDRIFIDAHLKVIKERGDLIDFLTREFNVLREYAKVLAPNLATAIDLLDMEYKITPFTIRNEQDDVNNLLLANGNKPIMSHLESIQRYGYSKDAQATLDDIQEEGQQDAFR